MILPPGAKPPETWQRWMEEAPLFEMLRHFEAGLWPRNPAALPWDELREAGVVAVALDLEPGGPLTEAERRRFRTFLVAALGTPRDYGIAQVWWVDGRDGPPSMEGAQAWRAALAREREESGDPDLPTLIKPSWWLKAGGPEGRRR